MSTQTDGVKLEIIVDGKTGEVQVKNFGTVVTQTMNTVREQSDKAGTSFQNLWKQTWLGNLATQAFNSVQNLAKNTLLGSISAYEESANAEAQMYAVLKSTAGAAGMTSDALVDLAAKMQAQTTQEDDAVLAAENLMLTFKKVGKDVFPKAIETVLDMSEALDQGLNASAMQLGKALQEPIEGVSTLRRVGIQFSDSQETVIKRLVESGKLMEAQKLILAELKTQFGGSAAAARDTFGGALKALQNEFGNLQEEVGKAILQEAIPILQEMVKTIMENKNEIIEMATKGVSMVGNLVETLWRFRDVIVLAGKAWLVWKAADMLKEIGEAAVKSTSKVGGLSKVITNIPTNIVIAVAIVGLEKLREMLDLLIQIRGDEADFKQKQQARSMDSTNAMVENYAALEKLGAEYTQVEAAVRDFRDEGETELEAFNQLRESIRKGNTDYGDLGKVIAQFTEHHRQASIMVGNLNKQQTVANNNSREHRVLTDAEIAALKKEKDAYEAFGASLGFVSDVAMKQVEQETRYLIDWLESYGGQLKDNETLQTKVWSAAIENANKYVTAGKAVPPVLREHIDKLSEYNRIQLLTDADAIKLFDDICAGFSGTGDYATLAVSALGGYQGAVEKINQVQYEWLRIMGAIYGINLPGLFDETTPKVNKATTSFEELRAIVETINAGFEALDSLFGSLGVDISQVTAPLKSAVQGVTGISQGFTGMKAATTSSGTDIAKWAGSAATAIGGIASIATAAIGIIKGLIKLFGGDGVGEAIERETQWMGLTDDQIKRLRELEKLYHDTHAAASEYLDEFIEKADMSAETMETWWARIRGILSDLDRGTFGMTKTISEISDAFTAMLEKAKAAGTEGSAAMRELFADLAGRGIAVPEIQEYLAENITGAFESYKNLKALMDPTELQTRSNELIVEMAGLTEGTKEYNDAAAELADVEKQMEKTAAATRAFGHLHLQVFEDAIALEKKKTENQPLTDGIKEAIKLLQNYSAATKLTQGEMDQFGAVAKSSYDELIKGGFSSKQALVELAPMLGKLKFLQEQYGYTLDDGTKKLIEMAEAADVNLNVTEPMQQIIDLLGEAVSAFKDLVGAIKGVGDETQDVTDNTREYKRAIDDAVRAWDDAAVGSGGFQYTGSDDDGSDGSRRYGGIAAADGFSGMVYKPTRFLVGEAGPEYVQVTPKGERGDGAGGSRTLNLNVICTGGMTEDAAAGLIIGAIRKNTRGVRSVIQGV